MDGVGETEPSGSYRPASRMDGGSGAASQVWAGVGSDASDCGSSDSSRVAHRSLLSREIKSLVCDLRSAPFVVVVLRLARLHSSLGKRWKLETACSPVLGSDRVPMSPRH